MALRAVRDDIHSNPPDWMADVLVTGIGPRISGGRFTNEMAIQLVLKEKRPTQEVPGARLVPRSFRDVPLDVVGASDTFDPELKTRPGATPGIGVGTPLETTNGLGVTATCGAILSDGRNGILTAAHAFPGGPEPVFSEGAGGPAPTPLGTDVNLSRRAWRSAIYGAPEQGVDSVVCVDSATVALEPGVAVVPTLPGGGRFAVRDPSESLDWLHESEATLFQPRQNRWVVGVVVQLWPRRTDTQEFGLCLVKNAHTVAGDSGSLWLAQRDGQYFALGHHWGLDDMDIGDFAFVVDLTAVIRAQRIRAIIC